MIVEIDTREKPQAIKGIIAEFDKQGIKHISTKLYVGDYRCIDNPLYIIDRKHNIAELASNATHGHDRFKRELLRLDGIGGKMVVLVEQNRFKDVSGEWVTVKDIVDLLGWKNPYGTIDGITVYKVLSAWEHKHNVEFKFCNRSQTGKRIIDLLRGESWVG